MYQTPIFPIQNSLFSNLSEMLDRHHPLYILSHKINWQNLEEPLSQHYSKTNGRPPKPIRLMCGLLILKHLRNISDESVVEQWRENAYYQYFCGFETFSINKPCESSELVHFRKRIGEAGIELILKESIRVCENKPNRDDDTGRGRGRKEECKRKVKDNHNDKGESKEKVSHGDETIAFIDTTVQEKNITHPTDSKHHNKIIKKCLEIAKEHDITLRQSYTRTLKKLRLNQRFRNHAKAYKKALSADRKIKTIAGRLVRELQRKLPDVDVYAKDFALFEKVLAQTKQSKNKIYSLHEPEVQCISKGKERKKYEFGNKVSLIRSKDGVILGALSFRNEYDGHTVDDCLEQVRRLTSTSIKLLVGDRGYRGPKSSGETEIVIPGVAKKTDSLYTQQKKRKLFRKRAGIEPTIGHLKSDYRLSRNFYKGVFGDAVNVMLAAAAYNFKRAMRLLFAFIFWLDRWLKTTPSTIMCAN